MAISMGLSKLTCINKLVIRKLAFTSFLVLFFGLFLSGCASLYDPESSQELHTDALILLANNQTASQTIFLPQASLSAFHFWASSSVSSSQNGKIHFSLYAQKDKTILLYSTDVPYPLHQFVDVSIPKDIYIPAGLYKIVIQPDSSPIWLFGSKLDSYPQGTLFLDNADTGFDLGFSVNYRYTFSTFLNDLKAFITNINLIIPFFIFLILPGFLLIKFLKVEKDVDLSLQLFLIIATSLSIYPIVLAWTTWIDFKWNPISVRIFFYSLLVISTIISIRNIPRFFRIIKFEDLFLFFIFLISLFVRLIMSRNLVAPAWVDSIHHSLITSIILDQGTFPNTYEPFVHISTASYHSGFHAMLAFFTWLSGLSLPQSMLLFGQVLNALCVYSVYSFTRSLFSNRWMAIVSAMIVGLITPMPAYYTSWGRYTQLAGLVIMPAIIQIYAHLLSPQRVGSNHDRLREIALFAILSSALIITHYRVSLFLALFLLLVTIPTIWGHFRNKDFIQLQSISVSIILLILFTFAFSLPWLPKAWLSLIYPEMNAWRGNGQALETIPIGLLTAGLGKLSLILAGLGILWGLWHRNQGVLILLAWVGLCFASVYLPYLGLPGLGLINATSVTISLFFPIAALGGFFITDILLRGNVFFPIPSPGIRYILVFLAFIILSGIAIPKMLPILNPITMLVRGDDLESMSWIKANIPQNEKILIHPFLWGYGLYSGSDGGTWIPALAKRVTIPPPVLFALTASPNEIKTINTIAQRTLEYRNNPEELANWMNINSIHYLYLGGRGGDISPFVLSQSKYFTLIFHHNSVFIFQVLPQEIHP